MKPKFKHFGNIHTIMGILLTMLLVQTASAETLFNNEFWISPVAQTNFADGIYGNGTLDCPYDGSTQAKFDGVMHYLCDDSSPFHHATIHLLAGTYQTLGDPGRWTPGLAWRLQDGQKLLGSGIDNTIIQLVSGAVSSSYVISSYPLNCSHIEVADLTVDANYSPASGAVSYGGMALGGTDNVARRVKVINVAWADPNIEVYGIAFYCGGNGSTNNSEGNIIEGCEVDAAPGQNGDGLAFNGGPTQWISGTMRNNRIVFSGMQGIAINGAWMRNTLIEGNYIKGSISGLYGDTGGYTNIVVAHNVFENCQIPVFLINVPRQNLTFCYNVMSSTTPTNIWWAFRFDSSSSYTNINIIGNTVTFNGNQPVSGSMFLWMNNITGLNVANNTVDPGLTSSLSGCTGVNMYFNYDLKGNPRTDLDTMGFSTMTSFGKSFLASSSSNAALVSLGLPANPAVILTNNQSQPVTFNTNVTVKGALNYSNMVAQLLVGGTNITTSIINTSTGQVVTVNVKAETVFTNEFWISTSTNTANLGTLSDPFDGSTQMKFDTVMHNLCGDYTHPNSTIHILAGTYQTLGSSSFNQGVGWRLQQGQKIWGSGIDNTIIRLVTNVLTQTYVIGSFPFGCSNMEVADLTLDGNYSPASGAISIGGVELDGNGGFIVRRVKVVNVAWADPIREVVGITFTTGGADHSDGNIIEECEVYSAPGAPGPGCDGLAFNGGPNNWMSGIMRNNRIVTPGIGCGGAWMRNTLIEGNYFEGATSGLYGDTGGYTNIMVAHNVFENCTYPVMIVAVPRQNLTFCFNTITLPSTGGAAFWFYSNGSYTNIVIIGNNVGYNHPWQPNRGGYFLWANNITGLVVANNTVDPDLSSPFSGCTGVNMYFNYDLQGNLRTDLDTMGFSTMTSFGKSFLASSSSNAALVSLGLPANPAVILTNNQSQPVTFNTNVTVNGALNYSNMIAQLLVGGTNVTTSIINTSTGQVVTVNVKTETVFTNEFWISTSTNTADLGTLDNPFNGSTQAKFDAKMTSLPLNCTVHLLAGTYQTLGNSSGGSSLKSGQKVLGSGIDNTVIRLIANAPGNGSSVYVMACGGYCSNNVVSDLTLDCNFNAETIASDGLLLFGNHHAVRSVKVINSGGTANYGSYGIWIDSNGSQSEGNVVENCEIGPVIAYTGSGIAFNGAASNLVSGIMRNNRIFFTPNGYQTMAISGSWMHNTLIEGNQVKGAVAGFYGGNGGGYTNIIVAHNVFEDCTAPIFFISAPRQNLMFCYNTISSTTPTGMDWAFRFDSSSSYTNIAIIGNIITFNGNQPAPGGRQFLWVNNITGLVVANNMVDPGLTSSLSGCTGVNMYFNYDLQGNPRTDLDTMGFSTMTSFGKSFLASSSSNAALVSLGLPGNPAVILTNNQSSVTLSGIFTGNGSGLTSLNASQLTSGTIPQTQLPSAVVTNQATGITLGGTFTGNGSGLTGITASQVGADASGAAQQATNGFGNVVTHNTGEFAKSTNATIWSSLSVTNSAAASWATLSVTPSNAVISVGGVDVAILQTNGVLNAYNGLSTTISNALSASRVTMNFATQNPYRWTNTTPANMVVYVNVLKGSVGYNGSFIAGPVTNDCVTVMLKPSSYLSVTNNTASGSSVLAWHPF